MKNLKKVLMAGVVFVLVGCGKSTSDANNLVNLEPDAQTPPPAPSAVYTVALTGLDVRRVSDGEKVEVDITGVESGEITLTP